jgi:phage gpG-like protein
MNPEQGISQLQRQFKSVLLRVPLLVGNEAVNFALDNFKMQGFQGATFQPWIKRKVSWVKNKRAGRNLLIDSGRLRRTIRITQMTTNYVAIGTDVKYAKAHNEGVNGLGVIQTVKGFSRKSSLSSGEVTRVRPHTRRINMRIPKRQYLGDSPYLQQRLKRVVSYAFIKEMPTVKL